MSSSVSSFDLIVTIVNKGWSEEIINATRQAGAPGGTIIYGRGTGTKKAKTLFGIPIEPEKEVILTVVSNEITAQCLEAITAAGKLEQIGTGIAFVLNLNQVVGLHPIHQAQPPPPNKTDR